MNAYGNTSCVVLENGTTGTVIGGNVMIATAALQHLLVGPNSPGNALRDDNRYYSASNNARIGAPFEYIAPSSTMWVL